MYNSIAPVELTSQMHRQFADPVAVGPRPARRPVRRAVSAALRALANRLEPAPTAS